MLAVIIAATALAAAAVGADVQGASVNLLPPPAQLPKFVQRPGPEEFAAAYPHGAAAMGVGGRAVVHCEIAHEGRLEKCRVVHEVPRGAGFGAAALSLSRAYRVDPQSVAAQKGELDLPIEFANSGSDDEPLISGSWLAAPSFTDVAAAYPDIGGGVTGQVLLHCALGRDGALRVCKTVFEEPADREFDIAALKLVKLFRMGIDPSKLRNRHSMAANVLVSLAAPFGDEAKQRRISDPDWLAEPDPGRLALLFPPEAAAKGVTTGLGYADCIVNAVGALTNCLPAGGDDPPGVGFSIAAARAAPAMRMSPWTRDGGPVDGARVRVPIRFTQAMRYAGP